MTRDEFIGILKESVSVGDWFGSLERPDERFTVDSISGKAIFFKQRGQIIKLSFSNCVDILNEFSGLTLADIQLHEFMPNRFNARYHYHNGICLLWLFTQMGLTENDEVMIDFYESGVPMYYVELQLIL
jgi:hypothetical protein